MITTPLPRYVKIFLFLAIAIMICYTLSAAREIIIPIALAIFFTFLLFPISDWLQSKKWPKSLAILVSILFALVVVIGLLYFFIYQILSFREDLPELEKNLQTKLNELQNFIESRAKFSRKDQTVWMDKKITDLGNDASSYIMNVFSATGAVLADLALIPIYIFFITYYSDRFKYFISLLIKSQYQEKIFSIMLKVSGVSQKYIKGILIDILILSILNSTGFLILGLKHAILFGTLAAFLNIVPYVGILIGSIFPVILALLTKDSAWYAVGVIGVCTFVQFLDNNFITPKVVGSSVSINPLAATVVLIIGASLWGVMGMILFIPITGMIKVLCDNIEQLRPYGYLIGEEKELKMPLLSVSGVESINPPPVVDIRK